MKADTFVRCALAACLVSGALAIAAVPAAAGGGAIHVRSSSFSVYASLVTDADGVSIVSNLTATMTDEATGAASLQFEQSSFVVDENGEGVQVGWANGSGDVHLAIASSLASASITGTIALDRCPQVVNGGCPDEHVLEAPIEGTWAASSKLFQTRSLTIVSASRTSRQLMRENASYRYADAQVFLDGVTLGSDTYPTQATINDARTSVVDAYFGWSGLPGTVVAGSITPSAVAGTGHTRFVSRWEAADAAWTRLDGDTERSTYFRASFDTIKSKSELQTDRAADYEEAVYVDAGDGWGRSLVSYTYGWAEDGTFSVAPNLSSASFAGSIRVQVCTPSSDWETVCIDGAPIDVTVSWASHGDVSRTTINQSYTAWDGSFHTTHNRMETIGADASGTIAGEAFGPSERGGIVRDLGTYDESAQG